MAGEYAKERCRKTIVTMSLASLVQSSLPPFYHGKPRVAMSKIYTNAQFLYRFFRSGDGQSPVAKLTKSFGTTPKVDATFATAV